MRFFVLVVFLFCISASAIAKCLSDPSFSDNCRYPKGDTWCAENSKGTPYAYSDNCLAKNFIYSSNPKSQMPINIKQDMQYTEARDILINDGWQFLTMHVSPNGTPNCNSENKDCMYPEIQACSGSGMGFCAMFFYDGKETYLELTTVGGSPPDAVIYRWNLSSNQPEITVHELD